MTISDAMLAQALLGFLKENQEAFERFVLERYDIDDGNIRLSPKGPDRSLLLTVIRRGQDGSTVAERDYSIRIQTIGPKDRA